MREIKFRAWDIGREKMVDNPSISFMRGWLGIDKTCCINCLFDNDDQLKWMQYIGLKDKNVKEIYGDSDYLQDDEGVIYMLKWWKEQAGWKLWFWDGTDWDWDEDIEDFYNYKTERIDLEIIGNKYENPELLENEESLRHGRILDVGQLEKNKKGG